MGTTRRNYGGKRAGRRAEERERASKTKALYVEGSMMASGTPMSFEYQWLPHIEPDLLHAMGKTYPSGLTVQESELLDISLVKDARCGKHARAPKVSCHDKVKLKELQSFEMYGEE
ncbi:hypothetical protein JRQ81_005820 [Phrynocephalus forsythii]|uniref:Uncharacterized protein n=1 Tax=Phrynocephalus forsythii TaxID=171643 RepID=A0A9Q0Y370_9SAUR|nr:hypothetical protein JRQ81_005820 [Phrynocephalus forsythii]